MSTTALQKMRRRAERAEAAALRMGVLLLQLRGLATIPEPLGKALADAINDYQALAQAMQRREAMQAKAQPKADTLTHHHREGIACSN